MSLFYGVATIKNNLTHSWSDQDLKSTVVNSTCLSIRRGSLNIKFTDSLIFNTDYIYKEVKLIY